MQPGMKVYVKTADICAMIGKSNQWVGQLTSQGTIHKSRTPHGNLFECLSTAKSYIDSMQEKHPADEDEASLEQERKAAEVQLKKAKARIADLEADELQGKMHRSEDVAAMTEDLIYIVRGMLLALPGRLARDAAAAQTPAEAAEAIRRELFPAMEELSRHRYDPMRYMERVRERMNWEAAENSENDDE